MTRQDFMTDMRWQSVAVLALQVGRRRRESTLLYVLSHTTLIQLSS
jgi:hypothetical protein